MTRDSDPRYRRLLGMLLALGGIAMAGCGSNQDASSAATQRVPDAEAVVESYLRQAVVTAREPVASTLFSCEREGPTSLELALADSRVQGSLLRGDTAIVFAEVVTVARVELAPDDTLDVRQQTMTDTLSWVLTHTAADSVWGICGYSREGAGFVRLEALGDKVRWVGGTSLPVILAAADSVVRRN